MSDIKIEKHSKKVDEEYYKKVGKKLIEIREGIGYTQRNVALALGITFQQYQKYESGVNRIPTKALAQFCELTGSDIREIAGATLEDYEIRYKQNIVNHYSSTYINNFNGLFSNLFNMDLRLMKNKIAVGAVIFGIIIFTFFQILKLFHILNYAYNGIFVNVQMLTLFMVLVIIMFVVYGYSWLTYIMAFFAYVCVISLFYKILWYPKPVLESNLPRFICYGVCILVTFLTFYILKKLKVNMTKKEEGPAVIDTRRQKANIPE